MSKELNQSAESSSEWHISSDPAKLREVRVAVEQIGRGLGIDEQGCHRLGLCVNEALANVMRHAYHGRTDQPIHILVQRGPDQVKVAIRDWGEPFDPREAMSRPYNPLQPGGVGMVCLKKLMDEVKFIPQPDGMLLEMICRRRGSQSSE